MRKRILLSSIFLSAYGCASSATQVNVNASQVSDIFKLDLETENSNWTRIGETPMAIDLDGEKLELYRIQNKDNQDQFVIMPSKIPDGQLSIDFANLKPLKDDTPIKEDQPEVDMGEVNDAMVSVLRAYAALWEKKPEAAKQLAEQAENTSSSLVGPPLIQALAAIMENNLEEAQAKLEVAKARPKKNSTLIEEIEKRISPSSE